MPAILGKENGHHRKTVLEISLEDLLAKFTRTDSAVTLSLVAGLGSLTNRMNFLFTISNIRIHSCEQTRNSQHDPAKWKPLRRRRSCGITRSKKHDLNHAFLDTGLNRVMVEPVGIEPTT